MAVSGVIVRPERPQSFSGGSPVKKSLFVMAAAVLALTSYGCGAGNNPAAPSTTLDSAPPQAPVGLVQTNSTIQWTANSESDLDGYQIYQYSPDPDRDNAYVLEATLPASQTTWALPNADSPTTSWIKLRALDRTGNRSAESTALQVSLVPVPAGTEPADDLPRTKRH
jgi:hypothetical protein